MTESTPFPPAFDSFTSDYSKLQPESFDFFSYQGSADAPAPEIFENELESTLASFDIGDLQLLTVENNDAYNYFRSDTPTCGPRSTITASSESAYDSISSYSESLYSAYPPSNYSFPLELEMDFQRIRVDPIPEYPSQALDTVDPTSFGALPPTPPRSPPQPQLSTVPRSSFSDYGPPRRASEYYNLSFAAPAAPAVPANGNAQLIVPSIPLGGEEYKGDPRKKYKCPTCPRAFARAYNLKTHMATHDPNRLKPHVCPHRTCGRSFSRKHDLGRHLVSIHRDESLASSHHSASSKKSIGVENGPRGWCDKCGKGWVGKSAECACRDVK